MGSMEESTFSYEWEKFWNFADLKEKDDLYNKQKSMHRPGIEPGPPPWQGEILPLDQRCFTFT